MTDARLPGRWLFSPALEGLSDRAFRTFAGALMWSAEQGTDGHIPRQSIRLLHPDGSQQSALDELKRAGLWDEVPGGYQVRDWALSQSLAADVARLRDQNRLRQQALRDRRKRSPSREPSPTEPRDVTRDTAGEERNGEDRQGQADSAPTTYWPTVQIPK